MAITNIGNLHRFTMLFEMAHLSNSNRYLQPTCLGSWLKWGSTISISSMKTQCQRRTIPGNKFQTIPTLDDPKVSWRRDDSNIFKFLSEHISYAGTRRFPKLEIPNSWMVFVMENPSCKWMIWGCPQEITIFSVLPFNRQQGVGPFLSFRLLLWG